ncbi:MAG: formate dehydrogenase subunit delta [Myxococcales bacterium]|nr:formate dehydrogenase subunit delta [Myxococcales bacterium]
MANQIGAFFASEPDHALAVEGVASHLRRFWEPRMRHQLVAWVVDTGGPDLSPLVLEAVQTNRARLTTLTPRNGPK